MTQKDLSETAGLLSILRPNFSLHLFCVSFLPCLNTLICTVSTEFPFCQKGAIQMSLLCLALAQSAELTQ